jgi:hypothetical protein
MHEARSGNGLSADRCPDLGSVEYAALADHRTGCRIRKLACLVEAVLAARELSTTAH